MGVVRKHIIFSGRVQGVGFRYHACVTARVLGLTGYVKNLSDGTVELEAQGEEKLIERLVESLKREEYTDIRGVAMEDRSVRRERDFSLG